ncbi:hypothetical protein ACROYT_G029515 [Oculina patagonica]
MKVHLISSRCRVFAIASTWVVAIIGNSFFAYVYNLVGKNGDIFCVPMDNIPVSFITYLKLYSVLFQILPVIAMTILYCVIAVTLRRQDKALQCRAVHQKDQRKRRAIKMSVCIMTAFYICAFPMLLVFLFREYDVTLSCSFWKALWFLANLTLLLSSVVNPLICVAFTQNYRLGLKEIFRSCWSKRSTTSNMVTSEQDGITLQDIRVIPWIGENRAYIE